MPNDAKPALPRRGRTASTKTPDRRAADARYSAEHYARQKAGKRKIRVTIDVVSTAERLIADRLLDRKDESNLTKIGQVLEEYFDFVRKSSQY